MFFVPQGGGKEGCAIKEGEEVIEDQEFYQRFFSEIEQEIKKGGGAGGIQEN